MRFALLFAGTPEATRQTTIVLINAIGSILYGPILAAFLLGMLTRWAGPTGIKAGIVAGIIMNLSLWLLTHFVALVESHGIAGDRPHLVHRVALRDRARTANFARG